jgi:hypothetical protein
MGSSFSVTVNNNGSSVALFSYRLTTSSPSCNCQDLYWAVRQVGIFVVDPTGQQCAAGAARNRSNLMRRSSRRQQRG